MATNVNVPSYDEQMVLSCKKNMVQKSVFENYVIWNIVFSKFAALKVYSFLGLFHTRQAMTVISRHKLPSVKVSVINLKQTYNEVPAEKYCWATE